MPFRSCFSVKPHMPFDKRSRLSQEEARTEVTSSSEMLDPH